MLQLEYLENELGEGKLGEHGFGVIRGRVPSPFDLPSSVGNVGNVGSAGSAGDMGSASSVAGVGGAGSAGGVGSASSAGAAGGGAGSVEHAKAKAKVDSRMHNAIFYRRSRVRLRGTSHIHPVVKGWRGMGPTSASRGATVAVFDTIGAPPPLPPVRPPPSPLVTESKTAEEEGGGREKKGVAVGGEGLGSAALVLVNTHVYLRDSFPDRDGVRAATAVLVEMLRSLPGEMGGEIGGEVRGLPCFMAGDFNANKEGKEHVVERGGLYRALTGGDGAGVGRGGAGCGVGGVGAPAIDTWRIADITEPNGRFGSTAHSWMGLASHVKARQGGEKDDARFIDWILLANHPPGSSAEEVRVTRAAVVTEQCAEVRESIPLVSSNSGKFMHPSDHFPVYVDLLLRTRAKE